MDIEQLKLVLETVGNVSGDAQTVAVWWLILDKFIPSVVILAISYGVYSLVLKIVRTCHNEKDLIEIRDSLGIVGSDWYLRDSEIKQIKQKIANFKTRLGE